MTTEIMLIISAIINAVLGWKLGGKQAAKSTENDTISRGADTLITASDRLIVRLEGRLDVMEKENIKLKDDVNNITVRLKVIESKCVGNCFI